MRKLVTGLALMLTVVGGGVSLAPAPAAAQDYLGAYLLNQRHDNLRRHQQRILQQRRYGRQTSRYTRERRSYRAQRYERYDNDRAHRSRRYYRSW